MAFVEAKVMDNREPVKVAFTFIITQEAIKSW